ncbi:MAG: leucyl/phenylalanyl-tRNA--protein transferase [Rickettsiales bacterium]|nr:leucyl/phenylalanyl-tRNA--protein transferase [Rickettsiales bacterium]OUV83278.1 MAG: leucyl/phenylalanyl-tRNA--protein transferase [Rickettsiales bacterium TMED131]
MPSYEYNIPITSVIEAYKRGLFPMAETSSSKEIYWIEPKNRGIFNLDRIKVPKKLKKFLKKDIFDIGIDINFEKVINNCAKITENRKDTWINETIKKIYIEMYKQGYAHSVECYLNQKLVGGLYGVRIGGMFFGESMFSFISNASKVALLHLIERLKIGGFQVLDTQFINEHLKQFGAIELPNKEFKSIIEKNINKKAYFYKFSKKGFLANNLYPLKNKII